MKHVTVYGSGCARCVQTADLIKAQAADMGIEIAVEKVTDYAAIAQAGIASTPGVAVDGALVHAGGLPTVEAVRAWLSA